MRRLLYPGLAVLLIVLVVWLIAPAPCDGTQCVVDRAVAAGNARACDALTSAQERAWCVTDVAAALDDARVCDRIEEERSRAFCVSGIAAANRDVVACRAITHQPARDDCLDALARSLPDGSLCGEIVSAGFRDSCAYDLGREFDDPQVCLLMADTARSYRCVTFVALDLNTTEPCALTPYPDSDWCITGVAVKLGNLSLCDGVRNTTVYSVCRMGILSRE